MSDKALDYATRGLITHVYDSAGRLRKITGVGTHPVTGTRMVTLAPIGVR